MLPHRLRSSLALVQWVGAATLLRSVLYDRWVTVIASIALIGGAYAAQRGKTWGVGVVLGSAIAFATAFAIGIAPAWFMAVFAIGAVPFLHSSRAFARFDAAATAVGLAIVSAIGIAGAVAWKALAPWVFDAVPALSPSWHANHVGLLAMLSIAVGTVAAYRSIPKKGEPEARMRVSTEDDTTASEEEPLDEHEESGSSARARFRA